jgi:hypothetical protein
MLKLINSEFQGSFYFLSKITVFYPVCPLFKTLYEVSRLIFECHDKPLTVIIFVSYFQTLFWLDGKTVSCASHVDIFTYSTPGNNLLGSINYTSLRNHVGVAANFSLIKNVETLIRLNTCLALSFLTS